LIKKEKIKSKRESRMEIIDGITEGRRVQEEESLYGREEGFLWCSDDLAIEEEGNG
jgi:hypothetical protein